jgi:hypothetical protein
MKYYTLSITTVVISILYTVSSCTDKLPEPATDPCASITPIYYDNHIKPLLDANCNTSGCHDNSAQVSFDTYSSLNTTRMSGIYNRVCVTQDMPPSGGLSSAIIDTFRCWKEGGYMEKSAVDLCSSVTVTYDSHIDGIFAASCNYSGCHDGTSQQGLSYASMNSSRRNLAASRVADQTMPPLVAPSLTTLQMDSIKCWKDSGFLEN